MQKNEMRKFLVPDITHSQCVAYITKCYMKLCHVRSGCRCTIQYSLYKGFHGAKAIAGPVQLVSQWAKYNSPFILAFAFLLRDYSRFTPDLPKEVFPSTVENSCLAFIENVNLSLFPTERALL